MAFDPDAYLQKFDPDSYLNKKTPFLSKIVSSKPEAPNESKSEVPLSVLERAKLAFGNPAGIEEYLNSKGISHEFKNGELYIGKGNEAKLADPNNLKFWLNKAVPTVGIPFDIANLIKNGFDKENAKAASAIKDIPGDLAESPSDVMNGLLTAGGAFLGGFGGPAAIATVPAGGAIGAGLSEKLKEKIGGGLGTYKNESGDFLTPEVGREALFGALASLPAGISKTSKYAKSWLGNLVGNMKIPQRLYGNATGLSKEIAKNPEIADILLGNKVTGSPGKLAKISEDQMKVLGSKLDAAFAGKEASYPEIVDKLKGFKEQFAAGNKEGAQKAMDDVLSEFRGMFSKETSEIPGGVMKRPSLDEFKSSLNLPEQNKFGAYVESPSMADPEDIIQNQYLKSKEGRAFIRRPKSELPQAFSEPETRIEGRELPLGRDLPESFSQGRPRVVSPGKTNVVDEILPQPSDEDLMRLYLQKYPEENIVLPSTGSTTKETIPLSDLNYEKSKLAKDAKRLYSNPDTVGSLKKEAQKSLADASRQIIEEKTPDTATRALNQEYNAYRALGDSLDLMDEKLLKSPVVPGSLREMVAKKLFELNGPKTQAAGYLYNLLNSAKSINPGINPDPKTIFAIKSLLQQATQGAQ